MAGRPAKQGERHAASKPRGWRSHPALYLCGKLKAAISGYFVLAAGVAAVAAVGGIPAACWNQPSVRLKDLS